MKSKQAAIFFTLFFTFIFNIECTNKRCRNISSRQISHENERVVFDSTTVMKYAADELISRNGSPISDIIFPINNADPSNKVVWNYVSRDSGIKIREQTWKMDSVNYVVIWFTKRDSIWKPFLFEFRNIWADYG